MSSNKPRLCFIGFGEAGQAIASGLREAGVEQIAAWDILFPEDEGARLREAGETIGARLASSAADAVVNSDIIISAVTAGSSLDAARSVAPHLSGNPYFLDVNSVSPARKKEAAEVLGNAARYVDVAILAPIHPKRHQTPLLVAGPHAQAVMPLLIDELDMRGAIASDEVGAAAALKMIRGVMIKGIEALTAECFIAAQRAGIAPEVAASLTNNYPTLDWQKVIDYNLERMASHGIRRAEEMEQVAATLRELGVAPLMTEAIVTRQREMGELGKADAVRAAKREGGAAMLRRSRRRQRAQCGCHGSERAGIHSRTQDWMDRSATRPGMTHRLPRRYLQKLRELLLGERRIQELQLHGVRHRCVEIGHLVGLHRGLRMKLLQRLRQDVDRLLHLLGIHLQRLRVGIHPVHRLAIAFGETHDGVALFLQGIRVDDDGAHGLARAARECRCRAR